MTPQIKQASAQAVYVYTNECYMQNSRHNYDVTVFVTNISELLYPEEWYPIESHFDPRSF